MTDHLEGNDNFGTGELPALTEHELIEAGKELNNVSIHRPKNIPLNKIIALHERGLNQTEIAKVLGCSKAAISKRLNKIDKQLQSAEGFKQGESAILRFKVAQLLENVDHAKIKKMTARDSIWGAAVLYDKMLLSEGRATEIQDVRQLTASVEDMRRQREELEAELAVLDST